MATITFTAGIKKFNIKAVEGLPQLSIELDAIVGLTDKTQKIVDTMNGPVVVTLTPAQSKLEFGKDKPPVQKAVKDKTKK